MVGRIKPGGLLWLSPDCSSFCGLCIVFFSFTGDQMFFLEGVFLLGIFKKKKVTPKFRFFSNPPEILWRTCFFYSSPHTKKMYLTKKTGMKYDEIMAHWLIKGLHRGLQ